MYLRSLTPAAIIDMFFGAKKKNSQRDQNLNKKSEFSNEKCFFFCGLYKIINKYILPINYVLNKHMVVFFTSIKILQISFISSRE